MDQTSKKSDLFHSYCHVYIYIYIVCNLILDKLTIQHREEKVEMYVLKFMYTYAYVKVGRIEISLLRIFNRT